MTELERAAPGTKREEDVISRDEKTVQGFGYEWTKFDQSVLSSAELESVFSQYFALFPWGELPDKAVGFDLGAGSGRWARLVLPRVGRLVCVDPSMEALRVATRNATACRFVLSEAGHLPFRSASMDFGYSLGVLHHTGDPLSGLEDAVTVLKPGAPFLVYLYYAFDNRPAWFRAIWRATDIARRGISRCPAPVRYGVSQAIALGVYFPLARLGRALDRRGMNIPALPLWSYRDRSFYIMRTDALDRFGTRVELRFTREQVRDLMEQAGLERVTVDGPPYWSAIGYKPVLGR